MEPLKYIIPIYVVLLIIVGKKSLKNFLLLTGIVTIPIPTTYNVIFAPHQGWVDGVVISLSDVSFIVLFLYLVLKGQFRWQMPRSISTPTLWFIIVIGLSMINSTMHMMTLYQMIMIGKCFLLYYFVLLNSLDNDDDLKRVVYYLSLAMGIQAVIGCAGTLFSIDTNFLRTGLYRPDLLSMPSGLTRATGTLGLPNSFAGYLVPLLLLNIVLFLIIPTARLFRVVVILLSLIGLVLSASRNGWVSFMPVLIMLIFHTSWKGFVARKYLGIFVVVLFAVLVLSYPFISDRITRSDHGSSAARIPLMELALNMFIAHPLTGVGGNTFANVADFYKTPDLEGMFTTIVHNQYLLVLAECGALGLFAYLWLIWSGFRESLLCSRNRSEVFIQAMGSGIVFALLSILILMMFDKFQSASSVNMLFVFFALASFGRNYSSALISHK